jgi:SOS-response transcriptional repressor LexA
MTLPLTPKQERLWRYIRSCERSPSFEEMRHALGYGGRGNVARMVEVLVAKGYAQHVPHRARSIVAIDPQESLTNARTSELIAELERRGVMLDVRL